MIRYYVNYQRDTGGAAHPAGAGSSFELGGAGESGLVILPSVGDYVFIPGDDGFGGRVRRRVFRYVRATEDGGDSACFVRIDVEETEDALGVLLGARPA